MRIISLILVISAASNASVLDIFQNIGIEYEVYGEGRLIPEKQHCTPYTLDLSTFLSTLTINEMSSIGKSILRKKVAQSFLGICQKFNISTNSKDSIPSSDIIVPDHLNMRFMDRFELAWNILKFERDLKSLFLENKINNPFLESIKQDTISQSGSSDVLDFSQRTTVFPKMCDVSNLAIEMNICFNISETPQSGMIYALAHGGEFLHNEEVYAYYEVPEFVLITPQTVIPIDLANCKVLFGTYIYCFEELDTQCDVRTLSDCPIFGYKTDDEFMLTRKFGVASIVATTENEVDVYGNGTKMAVPSRVSVLHTRFEAGTSDSEPIRIPTLTAHTETETSQFAQLLPETLAVLKTNEKTRLYTTLKRGVNMLSHKHYDQGAWDAVRSFFDRFI
ncbi:unnamed protein product [Caenorhabditis angaria]|uniref:Glycosyltransferase family 92 protein n=1 Tax=Caenorhabditis angaria TaxID=860376 RepID=A0A9P1MYX7_9PELO|nr:unnamed protein product [Caenorhabditis angaria]